MKYILLTVLLFTGCAKTNMDYIKFLNNESNIKNFRTLSLGKIKVNEEFMVSLGNMNIEIIEENGKKLFASKLQLDLNETFSLDIKSFTKEGFFAPKLIFFDNDYNVVKIIKGKDLRFDRGQFKGTIFINDNVKNYKYMVITQDLNKINDTHNTTSVKVSDYNYYRHASGDIKKTLNSSYGGNVKLLFKTYGKNLAKK